jgi:hypothetical protein
MAIFKDNNNNKYGMKMGQNRKPYVLLVGMQTSTTTMESSMEITQKLKIDLSYYPSVPLLGI